LWILLEVILLPDWSMIEALCGALSFGLVAPSSSRSMRQSLASPTGQQWTNLHNGLRESALIEIDGVGHFPWFEAPDEFFSLVKAPCMAEV